MHYLPEEFLNCAPWTGYSLEYLLQKWSLCHVNKRPRTIIVAPDISIIYI